MENCYTCRYAREKFENIDGKRMLFYCEKNEVILVAFDEEIYTCDGYESNLHDHNAAP